MFIWQVLHVMPTSFDESFPAEPVVIQHDEHRQECVSHIWKKPKVETVPGGLAA